MSNSRLDFLGMKRRGLNPDSVTRALNNTWTKTPWVNNRVQPQPRPRHHESSPWFNHNQDTTDQHHGLTSPKHQDAMNQHCGSTSTKTPWV
ncbi:hypothetical protein CEXT_7441 [Caerostris extrusa]|uniref:Uncharacterized protein n=1 Tax=Caerostris extrusa TaxID=172846 RepID=A0AAV4W1Z1_CAEEX|nr:hypothetical protein CEXT_7441 [Caerostris extrusa]